MNDVSLKEVETGVLQAAIRQIKELDEYRQYEDRAHRKILNRVKIHTYNGIGVEDFKRKIKEAELAQRPCSVILPPGATVDSFGASTGWEKGTGWSKEVPPLHQGLHDANAAVSKAETGIPSWDRYK